MAGASAGAGTARTETGSGRGLAAAGMAGAEIDRYLGVVADRVRCKGTGSSWMRSRRRACQGDLRALVGAYLRNQQRGRPVHLWPL